MTEALIEQVLAMVADGKTVTFYSLEVSDDS